MQLVRYYMVYFLILRDNVCLMKKCEVDKEKTHFIRWIHNFFNSINQKHNFDDDLEMLFMLKDDQFDARQIFYKVSILMVNLLTLLKVRMYYILSLLSKT